MSENYSGALDALFHFIQNDAFSYEGASVLFLNAQSHVTLSSMKTLVTCQQNFKPHDMALEERMIDSGADYPEDTECYDHVWIMLPKNMVEARFVLAKGIVCLKKGGVLICAADNKAGGTRLKALMTEFGLGNIDVESRNKARVASAVKGGVEHQAVEAALKNGAPQEILDGAYQSWPGMFGWDKVDKGSEILARFFTADMKGKGADFGCGYGYLSRALLESAPKVKALHCLDADYRAVQMCALNMKASEAVHVEFSWCDLTKVHPDLHNLDFIIMNPPFHSGKKTDIGVGRDFIKTAYAALRRGGRLYMVANAHLPYERCLEDIFFDVKKRTEEHGFKVFEALK